MQFEVIASARSVQGSSASRRLRRAGTVPGIVYGGDAAPQVIGGGDSPHPKLNIATEALPDPAKTGFPAGGISRNFNTSDAILG